MGNEAKQQRKTTQEETIQYTRARVNRKIQIEGHYNCTYRVYKMSHAVFGFPVDFTLSRIKVSNKQRKC
jgi:hypothetical protein